MGRGKFGEASVGLRDDARIVSMARRALAQRLPYVACTTLYWLWTGLVFQGPAFYSSTSPALPLDIPTWWMPMILYALSYVIIGLGYRRMARLAQKASWFVAVACAMTLGVIACVVWIYAPIHSMALSASIYCLGTFAVSLGAACFLTIVSRVNGYVGPQVTLVIYGTGMIAAALLMVVFAVLPSIVCHAFLLLLPSLFVACALRMYAGLPCRRLFDYSRVQRLVKPKKLLLTSTLHGLPYGLVVMLLDSTRGGLNILLFNAACFAAGALLLLCVMSTGKLDFNRLIYLAGFPVMGVGLLLVSLMPAMPLAGCVFLVVGYAFVHLVMCGVNAYLAKQFGIPMPWILAWTTCYFMLGQAAGVLVGLLARDHASSLPAVGTCLLFILLLATTFLVDNRNMQYGWGVVNPSDAPATESPLEVACRFLSADHNLTDREAQILVFLAAGRGRRHIGEELGISEETVKSHVRAIYDKLGVHNKDELIDMVQGQIGKLEN